MGKHTSVGQVLQMFVAEQAKSCKGTHPFCRKLSLSPNALESFLGKRNDVVLRQLLGSAGFEEVFVVNQDQQLELALASLSVNPHDTLCWITLQLLLEEAAMPAEVKAKVSQILRRVDLTRELAKKVPEGFVLVMLVSRFASYLQDSDLSKRLQQQIYELALASATERKSVREPIGENEAFYRFAGSLMDATANLARISDDPRINVSELCDRYIALLRHWPELAGEIRDQVTQMLHILPTRCQSKIWPLIFMLRSLQ